MKKITKDARLDKKVLLNCGSGPRWRSALSDLSYWNCIQNDCLLLTSCCVDRNQWIIIQHTMADITDLWTRTANVLTPLFQPSPTIHMERFHAEWTTLSNPCNICVLTRTSRLRPCVSEFHLEFRVILLQSVWLVQFNLQLKLCTVHLYSKNI